MPLFAESSYEISFGEGEAAVETGTSKTAEITLPTYEQEEIAIINREIKQTNQSLDGAKQAERADLIEKEEAKLTILKSFLPKQLSEEEIIAELQAAGIASGMNMGDAMKIAKPLLAGKADGAAISKAVKSIIA